MELEFSQEDSIGKFCKFLNTALQRWYNQEKKYTIISSFYKVPKLQFLALSRGGIKTSRFGYNQINIIHFFLSDIQYLASGTNFCS